MAATALVQTRIDPEIRDKASAVLERVGLTVSDAVRMMLTRTANEGALPFAAADAEYDAWFRAKVQEALDEPGPGIPGEEVEAFFAKKRAEWRKKAELMARGRAV